MCFVIFICFAATILDRVYLLRGEFQRFERKASWQRNPAPSHGKRKGLHAVGLTLGQLRGIASSGRDAGKVSAQGFNERKPQPKYHPFSGCAEPCDRQHGNRAGSVGYFADS